MLRVGLTGGIACGKSRVLQQLAVRGCRTLDLDQAAREAVAPGSPALAEIEAAFGASVLRAGALDRTALGALVFAEPQARARLNAIVHPRVRALEASWSAAQPKDAVLVVDAALLVEAGAHLRFDRLVVVHCSAELQLARLRARDGLDEGAARARIGAQMPVADKRAYAHVAIDSSGSLADTDRAADAVFEALSDERQQLEARADNVQEPLVPRLLGGLVHGPRVGPRGLSPESLLQAAAAAQGELELEALAARLDPKATSPWYEAARQAPPRVPAVALGPALVAWALATRPPDADFLVSAAASLARLTHAEAAPRGEACLFALLLQEVALVGRIPTDLEARARAHRAAAARWGGSDAIELAPILAAALAFSTDPGAARAAAESRGGGGALAAALVGVAIGARAHEAPALAATLERIRVRRI